MILNNKVIFFIILFTSVLLYSQTTEISKIDHNGLVQVETLDNETEEVYYFKTYINRIEGLKDLPNLKTVILEKTAFFETDYKCLSELSQIEVLILIDVKIDDTSFLQNLTNLKALILQGVIVDQKSESFRLPNKLNYLEISNSGLKSLPNFFDGDLNIREINLSYNNINHKNLTIEDIQKLLTFDAVILTGNPVLKRLADRSLKDINIYSDPQNLLNREYKKYLR